MAIVKSVGGLFLLIVIAVAILGGGDDENGTADDAPEPASATASAPDSGRMSDGEYATFEGAQAEVVSEALQFSDGLQKCVVIGQAGDFAGFSTCMDEAYAGFEEDASYADFITEDTLDDTAKKCQAALRSYRIVLADLDAAVGRVHRAGSLLQFEALASASSDLPRAANRYTKFAGNALLACGPR